MLSLEIKNFAFCRGVLGRNVIFA
jgi:hypothetical protein